MTNSMEELADADAIFILGSNTTAAHPLVATRIYRAKAKGAKLIVADPRRIQLAQMADLYLPHKLGSDVALLNGMMHVILEQGWQDSEFVDQRTEAFEEFSAMVRKFTPEKASEITGVPAEDIVRAAELYAKADKGSIVYCMGITQHVSGVDNVKSLANLAMLTGNVGRESTGVNPLRGQNNVQGACDMGGLPNVYPAYQPVTSLEVKEKFEKSWGGGLSGDLGLTIPEMLHAAEEGKLKALYILGENPVLSDPDAGHVVKVLKGLELLVVQDIFRNETADLAHVVLAGTSFAEKDGTFSNTERRVQRVRQAVEPVGDSRPDWQIIQEVARRFGMEMDFASPKDIFDEIARVTPSYGGISYERLEDDGLCWPCPTAEHAGTRFLHQGQFSRGKGLFAAIDYRPPAEIVDTEYPLWLTTGRSHVHFHTGTMTRNSPTLHAQQREGAVEINPADAEGLSIGQGDTILVASRRGEIQARAQVTPRVQPGTVFMPFHFAEACANKLTNPAMDPIAKIPEFKVCAVKVRKAA